MTDRMLLIDRRRLARLLLYVALALLFWGTAVFVVDGFRFRVLGVGVSARNPERPILLAAVLIVVAWFADRALFSAAARRAANRATHAGIRIVDAISQPAWSYAWCLAVGLFVYAIALGARAASGADSSGYVSQAALWADRELVQTVPLAAAVPWPDAVETFSPLGFRPAPDGPKIVPTYPTGLPMLMALFRIIGGHQAVFLVVPLCAAAVILLTYGIGLRLGTPIGALGGAIVTATSPTVLFMTLLPMSDLPVTAFWLGALVCSLTAGPQRPLAAGVMTGIAIVIRPNLVPLAIVPVALLAAGAWSGGWRQRLRSLLPAVIPIAVGVATVTATNAYLYGGLLRSGYGAGGDAISLYSVRNIVPNTRLYTAWLLRSHGVLIVVALAALAWQLVWRVSISRRAVAIFVALVIASYLPYIVFDDWWYLRFLLPALPLLYFFGADLVSSAASRFGRTAQAAIVVGFVVAMGVRGIAFGVGQEMYGVGEGEQRYAEVGRFIRDRLSRKAVILAMQHSGSIRYYAGTTIVRYDLLPAAELDSAVVVLRGLGYGPYLVLEDWEEPQFRQRFKDHETVKTLDSRLIATLDSNSSVRVYDLSGQPLPATPHSIRHIPRTACPGRFDE